MQKQKSKTFTIVLRVLTIIALCVSIVTSTINHHQVATIGPAGLLAFTIWQMVNDRRKPSVENEEVSQ
jgi:Flp pilus assembly protein TadB